MRMIITVILLILFHQLLMRVAYVSSQTTSTCTANSVRVEDKGSPYNSVNMYFWDSSCQSVIQQEIGNAMKSVCAERNKSEEAINSLNSAITTTLRTLEWKINYILEKATNLKLITGTTTCRTGYDYYQQDKFCYKLYSDCKTWSEARQICQQDGADLISLNDRNLNFFRDLARSKAGTCENVWVGTADLYAEGRWNWLNGQSVSSIFWQPDQPDNYGGTENCGDLAKMFGYLLNDETCSAQTRFLCQIA